MPRRKANAAQALAAIITPKPLPPLCVNCKRHSNNGPVHWCRAVSLITGEAYVVGCAVMRSHKEMCGPSGALFEPKP
jgi:hypothetical protein